MSYLGNSPVPDESVFEVLLDTKADVVHEHVIADVPGLQAVLDGKVTNTVVVNKLQEFGVGSSAKLITDWNSVVGSGWYMANELALNAPIANWCIGTVIVHNSEWQTQEVWGFSSNDDGGDTGTWRREKNIGVWSAWHRVYKTGAEIASAISALNTYAPIASPTFTGTPTAPTAATGNSTSQIATTAFVDNSLTAFQNSQIDLTLEYLTKQQFGTVTLGSPSETVELNWPVSLTLVSNAPGNIVYWLNSSTVSGVNFDNLQYESVPYGTSYPLYHTALVPASPGSASLGFTNYMAESVSVNVYARWGTGASSQWDPSVTVHVGIRHNFKINGQDQSVMIATQSLNQPNTIVAAVLNDVICPPGPNSFAFVYLSFYPGNNNYAEVDLAYAVRILELSMGGLVT